MGRRGPCPLALGRDRGCGGPDPGLSQRCPVPVLVPRRTVPSPPHCPPQRARPLQGESRPAEGTADRGIAPSPPRRPPQPPAPPSVSPAWQRDVSDTSAGAFDRPAAARLADRTVCVRGLLNKSIQTSFKLSVYWITKNNPAILYPSSCCHLVKGKKHDIEQNPS